MISPGHAPSIRQQCAWLEVPRTSWYRTPKPRPVSEENRRLMHRIDRLHLEWPCAGARTLRYLLRAEGHEVGRDRVARLMKRMGLQALYRKPRTTQPHPGHQVYPYLLRDLVIDRPNQVWAMDITYLPMAKGFLYLVAVMDWHTRRVLSWKLSNTMDTSFCLEALAEALARHGPPEIVNTDQGSQFTSEAFTGLLKERGIRISMDGRGAWRDNRFIERLWRSVKYEEVYLHAYETVAAAQAGLERYFKRYNGRRPHHALDGRTPDDVYYATLPSLPKAA